MTNFTLRPDSRRPCVALVCDGNGEPIEYASNGKYSKRYPFDYIPGDEEKQLLAAIAAAFPSHFVSGITPRINEHNEPVGRFEARSL